MPASTTGMMTTTPASMGMPGHDMSSMTTSGAAAGMNVTPTGSSDPMTESLKSLSSAQFEIKFMQSMIAHHQSAVDMARLALTNTKRPELQKLVLDIISSQTSEISAMTGWLAGWYQQKPLTDTMSMPGMMSMADMTRLKNAKDAEFDRMFINMMIPHHQSAVMMAKLIPEKTQRPELVKLGQDIIKAQTTEIEQMQNWQKTWFPA